YVISANVVNNKRLDYDMFKDYTVLAPISAIVLMAVANPSFPPNNIAELIAYIKANPGKVNLGIWSYAGIQQLAHLIVADRAGQHPRPHARAKLPAADPPAPPAPHHPFGVGARQPAQLFAEQRDHRAVRTGQARLVRSAEQPRVPERVEDAQYRLVQGWKG